jgi:hypothetical protein
MLTLALFALCGIAAAVALFLLAANFLPAGEQIAPSIRDEPIWTLPADRMLSPADVADVRLPVALRGYRFAETDLLLDRLGEELKLRDAEISALRSGEPWPPVEIAPAYPDESFRPLRDEEVSNAEAPNPEPGLEL